MMENLNKSEVITKLYTFEELIISMNIHVTLHIVGVEEERYWESCQTIEQAWFSYLVLIKILHDGYFYSFCRCGEGRCGEIVSKVTQLHGKVRMGSLVNLFYTVLNMPGQ